MKNWLRDPFVCGVLTFQVAALALVYGQRWGDSVAEPYLSNKLRGATLETGSLWPNLTAYDRGGKKRLIVMSQPHGSAVIIKGTCSCEDNLVSNWLQSEHKRGEPVTLVIAENQDKEERLIRSNGWTGRILRTRLIELERLGLLQDGAPKKLPLIAHLDPNGIIMGVQFSQ